jgi:UDP-GlcNAc:undecaprenyl-phosphate/decaprenyl-phosphate GlcNAc-1-phosphate transferase
MSGLWPLVAVGVSFVVGIVGGSRALTRTDLILRTNYAGRAVPVVMGHVLVSSANAGLLVALGLALLAGPVPSWPAPLIVCGGTYLLLFIGGIDDRSTHEARGVREHLASLIRGAPTTGIWKLVVGVAVSAVIAAELGGGVVRVLAATLVIALSINVTNALDVRPGRAIKWGLLVLVPVSLVLFAHGVGLSLATAAYVGGAAGVVRYDLAERGMLGDAGSNPLGLVLGTGLATSLPGPGLVVALLMLLGLQVAAETVTISRMIEAVVPLRWLDRLGRRS